MTHKSFGQTLVLHTFIFLLVCMHAYSQSPEESFIDVQPDEQSFPILGEGSDTVLAIEMTIGIYPEGTTLSTVREMVAPLTEAEKAQVPEYLLLKEHELAIQGDKDGIVALYETEADKDFAQNERWSNMAYSSSFFRNDVEEIVLQTKARFGPYVRIRYKPMLKEGRSFGRSVVLKESEKGYHFSQNLGKKHIFLGAATAFPYWKNHAERQNTGNLNDFMKTRIHYAESKIPSSSDTKSTEYPVKIFYKLEEFSGSTSMDASLKGRIQNQLGEMLQGYKTQNPERIAESWAPSERVSKRKLLQNVDTATLASAEYFENLESINPMYFIMGGEQMFLFAIPIDISGKRAKPKLFRFKQEGGEYFLSDGMGKNSPLPNFILSSPEFQKIIEKHLENEVE